jgi:CHAT domain-containing protein/antitoxin component YwqK of YwqJK toxin-antitoxin module/tetratricopeptide (TPR) repeat protein
MHKLKLLSFLMLLNHLLMAQVSAPNKLDQEGRRTGDWVIYYNKDMVPTDDQLSAVVYYLADYKKGIPQGFTKEYDMKGKLLWEAELRSIDPDTIHGWAIAYYANGNKQTEYHYEDGLMQGISTSYYESGAVKWQCNYTHDYPDGLYREFHENGKLMREGPVVMGKKNGYFEFYRDNGTLIKGVTYLNDVMQGLYRDYDDTGRLRYEYATEGGKSQGLVTIYDTTGAIVNYNMFWQDSVLSIYDAITNIGNNLAAGDQNLGLGQALILEEYFRKVYGEDNPLYNFPVVSIAQYYYAMGDLESGYPWTVKSFDLEKKYIGTEHEPNADSWHLLGLMLDTYGESDKAWEAYRYAITASYEKNKPTITTLYYMSRAAALASSLKRWDDGFKQYESLLDVCEDFGKQGDETCTEAALDYAGYLSSSLRNQKALEVLESGAERANRTSLKYRWQYETADVLMSLNQTETALETYNTLYQLFPVIKDTSLHADVTREMANYYTETGKYAVAEKLWLESIDISASMAMEDSSDYYSSIYDLADYYGRVGRTDQAIEFAEKSLAFQQRQYNELPQRFDVIFGNQEITNILISESLTLGRLYSDAGRYEAAGNIFVSALQLAGNMSDDTTFSYARALEAYAGYLTDIEDFDAAEKNYLHAIQLSDTYFSDINVNATTWKDNLSELYTRMNRPEDALQLAREVLNDRAADYPEGHPLLTASYGRIANIYANIGQTDSALALYAKSLDIQLADLNNNFSVMNAAEQEAFLETFRYEFEVYNDIAAKYGNEQNGAFQKMLDYQIANKSLLLFSNVAARRSFEQHADEQIRHDYGQWLSISQYLSRLRSSDDEVPQTLIDSLQQVADNLEKSLSVRAGQSVDYIPAVEGSKLIGVLQPDEAFVAFIRYPDFDDASIRKWFMGAIVVKAGSSPVWVKLSSEEFLSQIFSKRPGETDRDHIDRLYLFPELAEDSLLYQGNLLFDSIWKPILPELESVKRIYFTPDGVLNQLNLSAIPTPSNIWIGMQYDMIQLAGAGRLASGWSDQPINKKETVTLFGGIDYEADEVALQAAMKNVDLAYDIPLSAQSEINGTRGDTWNYLPGTLAEVQGVDALLRPAGLEVRSVTGNKASEEVFKSFSGQQAPGILHIATHGFFRNEEYGNPMYSTGLLLAGGNKSWQGNKPGNGLDDGILTAAEVSYLNMSNTKLVVLSACETGLGQLRSNEGVFGLQRAFILAGVPNLMMSMWKVSDKETAIFMQAFYRNLAEGKPVHEAFTATQKEMSRRYSPYYWAAFQLIQ